MDYYSAMGTGYDRLHREEQERKLSKVMQYLTVEDGDFLLDVGCGSGFIFENFDQCDIKIGVDPAPGLVCLMQHGEPLVGKGERLPFRDHLFDVVVSFSAIHHCLDIDSALDEILRVGKQRFALTVFKRGIATRLDTKLMD
eukprot:TRINITY_DN5148_c0_g1_i1.p1 TRINITY_DN5148_c0_g1~~TRINITY_DN5148_c0_g1_i1.p1  ORF type:complete len:141 (+),score=28.15 TRINITY_DN5148_c0_g1_i1:188-610(+)